MPKKEPKNRVVRDLGGVYDLGSKLATLVDGHYHIQVGIFGNKDARNEVATKISKSGKRSHVKVAKTTAGVTNAEIGFVHEMGSKTRNIPRRSFLWLTFDRKGPVLEAMLKDIMKGLFNPTTAGAAQTTRDEGKIREGLKKIALQAENLVQMAFQTGGFGWWAPLQPGTIKAKGSSKPLIDVGQLRRSISSRVRR
jgi:phage gpG-like protein